jgi:hypothetical protein
VRRLDNEKLRTRRIIATALLTVVAIALLVLSDASTPASAMPETAQASYQAAGTEVPSEMQRPIEPQEK